MEQLFLDLKEKMEIFVKEALPISERTQIKEEYFSPQYRITKTNPSIIECYSDSFTPWNFDHRMGNIDIISQLKSYRDALELCKIIPECKLLADKQLFGLCIGRGMSYKYIPLQFLLSMIFNERSYYFRQETFDKIFSDFMSILSNDHFSKAVVITPLIGLNSDIEIINLEIGIRIRKTTADEFVKLLNKFSNLDLYHTTSPFEQVTHLLEIDWQFHWEFIDSSDYAKIGNSSQAAIFQNRLKINEEIMILRALTKSCISIKGYCIDYQGWLADRSLGGFANSYHILPWGLPTGTSSYLLNKEIQAYLNYREKYLNLPENASKHKIFFAMRKLAFGLEKLYGCDEIFDTISGLEGLLVPAMTNGKRTREKQKKCINAVSSMFTGKIQDLASLKNDLEAAYRFRNDVAHGDITFDDPDISLADPHPKDKYLKEICRIRKYRQITRETLFEAIKLCIDNPLLVPPKSQRIQGNHSPHKHIF